MKQFHFEYRNQKALLTELARIKRYCSRFDGNQAVFQIYTKEMDERRVREITDMIEQEIPEAYYYGCLSCGNLLDGELAVGNTIIVCAIFEYDTTSYRVVQISYSDSRYEEKLNQLIEDCNSDENLKSIEILTTASMFESDYLRIWNQKLNPMIHCVGGCASNPEDTHSLDTFVFTKEYGFSKDAAVFFMLGGADVHASSSYVLGFEPLGGTFTATDCEKNILRELDGKPAFDVYKRYLKIENNEHFFSNALGFPIIMTKDGIDYIRVPVAVLEDGAVMLSGKVDVDCKMRLSYGNQSSILREVDEVGKALAGIGPEAIRIYSCFTRKLYWGEDNISKETEKLSELAPTTGFFTRGEILRIGKEVSQLSSTLVVIGLREGEPVPVEYHSLFEDNEQNGVLSYDDRLINFIGEATKELEAANYELERASIIDGLTKIYNRTEIQRRIVKSIDKNKRNNQNTALIMLDLDNFKRINDTYGHTEGDLVIQGLSSILLELDEGNVNYSAGRWGGEEFMMLIENESEEAVCALAEAIRERFSKVDYTVAERQSVSIGVTMLKPADNADTFCVRVDKALYQAKNNGKNRVEIV